jgi:hypothetical protein
VFIVSATIAAVMLVFYIFKRFATHGMRRAINDSKLHQETKRKATPGKPSKPKQPGLLRFGVAAAMATWVVVGVMLLAGPKSQAKHWQPKKTTPPAATATAQLWQEKHS